MLPSGRKVIEWLSSTQLSIILFGLLASAAIPGTLLKSQREYYSHPFFQLLIIIFALHLALCTFKRFKLLAKSTLVVHSGVLITLAGAVMTGTGYVATINIYEGESSKTVYRWDLKQDTPFSHEIRVKKINKEFHPVSLQIGIMKLDKKHDLKTLKSGDSFMLEAYSVKVDSFDPWKEVASFTISKGAEVIGNTDTSGVSNLAPDFPFSFKLVAFKDAVIKRFWVDLELLENGHMIQSGVTEINAPFSWRGLDIFNTSISLDPEKRPYAGIQIVRDPGKYVVYTGMFILSVGTIAAWYRRFKR
ncbi:MAG: ResB-like family cytochrome C biogenesis protein [Geobacteraceae bacterium]|nr:ResB-like family cytochrome C biogenesis protein [Geobacteraceae bacterium]